MTSIPSCHRTCTTWRVLARRRFPLPVRLLICRNCLPAKPILPLPKPKETK